MLDRGATVVSGCSDLLRQAHKNRSLHLNIAPNVGFVNVCVGCGCVEKREKEKAVQCPCKSNKRMKLN